MPSETPGSPTPSRNLRDSPFYLAFMTGVVLVLFPMVLAGAFFGEWPNVHLAVLPAAFVAWLLLFAYRASKSKTRTMVSLGAMSLGFFIASGMMLLSDINDLSRKYNSIAFVEQFAQQDFARFESPTVTVSQLDAVFDRQKKLQKAMQSLEERKAEIGQLPLSDAAKTAETLAVAAQEAVLQAQMLSDGELARYEAAEAAICEAGPGAGKPFCSATQAELAGFRTTFETRYVTWLRILRFIGAV